MTRPAKTLPLDQLLQREGFGTRRGCRSMVFSDRITVAGVLADDPDVRLLADGTPYTVDGAEWVSRERIYLAMHKPLGHEVSRKPQHHASVFALLPPALDARGVQPVGRLDADSTGLLIFSDDGDFIHHLGSPRHAVTKTYVATLAEPGTAAFVHALRTGVQLRDERVPVAAASAELLAADTLRIVLTEGRYHQVRRMVAAAGNHVLSLHRPGIGSLVIDERLPEGSWRYLDPDEVVALSG